MILDREALRQQGILYYDSTHAPLTGTDAQFLTQLAPTFLVVESPLRLAYTGLGEHRLQEQTRGLSSILDGCCRALLEGAEPSALEVGVLYTTEEGERVYQEVSKLTPAEAGASSGADLALVVNSLIAGRYPSRGAHSPLAIAYDNPELDRVTVMADSRLVVYSPESKRLTRNPKEMKSEELDELWRLRGWQVLGQIGAPIPAGIGAFRQDLFHLYRVNKEFAANYGPHIKAILQQTIDKYGRVSFRRVVKIPGIGDPVGISRVITSAQEGLDLLIQIYEKTIAAATDRAAKMGGDTVNNLQAILGETTATALFHQYVDTVRLKELSDGQIVKQNGGGRWPASAYARPLDDQATRIEVCFGYGKEKGVEHQASKVVLRFDLEEEETTPNVETISIEPQAHMTCILERKGGEVDGDVDILVPSRLQYRQALSLGEIETLAMMVRKAYTQCGLLARIEAGLGVVEGRAQIYVTELLPYDPNEDRLTVIKGERRRALLISSEADLVRALDYLRDHKQEKIFIGFAPVIARGRQDDVLDRALALLKEEKDRIILLPPTESGTAHQNGRIFSQGFAFYPIGSLPYDRQIIKDGALVELSYQTGGNPEVKRIAETCFVSLKEILGISETIGAKAVNLAKTAEQGFRIARGGVILPSSLEVVLKANNLWEQYNQLMGCKDQTTAQALSNKIYEGLRTIPENIIEATRIGLKEIMGTEYDQALFLARSAGGLEDGGDLFAGVYESSEPIKPDNLHEGVLLVYKSLFTEKAINYIFNRGFSLTEALSMSVLIQESINKDRGEYFYLYSSVPWDTNVGTINFGDDPRALAEGINQGGETVTFIRESGDIIVNGEKVGNLEQLYPDIWNLIRSSEAAFRADKLNKGRSGDVAIDAEGVLVIKEGVLVPELTVFQRRPIYLD